MQKTTPPLVIGVTNGGNSRIAHPRREGSPNVLHSTVFSSDTLYSLVRVRGALTDALKIAAMLTPRETRGTEPAPDSLPANSDTVPASSVATTPAPSVKTIPAAA